MIDGYDLLVKAQCSESMETLGFSKEQILEVLQNENRFDVISRLCERIAFLLYQDSNFGLLPIDETVSSSINRLCKSIVSAGFPLIENETFVGPSTSSDILITSTSNHSKERILCALLLTTPRQDVSTLLPEFSSEYPSTASFSQKLLDNDERFLTCMLALLPLIEDLDPSSVLYPVSVFLESMHLISYDCEVLIDWINSELAASSLILRILKSNFNEKTRRFWTNYEPKNITQSSLITSYREEPCPPGKPVISLKIIEHVGNQKMTKTVNLHETKFKRIAVKKPEVLRNSGRFERWIQMVSELRIRLKKLLAAKLVAEKLELILKWTDTVCVAFEE
uniref:Uncharacterized protein n=1 Tax=Caenorhabditis tropicalis TaxID=1561998 RepID=A0A1I7ULU6_9PELO